MNRKRRDRIERVAEVMKARLQMVKNEQAKSVLEAYRSNEQVKNLCGFENEYVANLVETGSSGMSSVELQEYVAFVANLRAGKERLEQQVESLQEKTRDLEKDVLEHERREQGLQKLLDSANAMIAKEEERRERIELENFSGRNVAAHGWKTGNEG